MFSVRLEKNQKWGFSQSKCKPPVFTNEKKKSNAKKEQCTRQQDGREGDHMDTLRQQLGIRQQHSDKQHCFYRS